MTWSFAILDDGITNATQVRVHKATASEFDFSRNRVDTDEGIAVTHGNWVFLSAIAVSRSLDVLDYKIGGADDPGFSYSTIEAGLQGVLAAQVGPVGAVSMSFGGSVYPSNFADEIARLGARGVIAVAASGNGGSDVALEQPTYPAALAGVIAVGSHDGRGNPSVFSQNGPRVAVLADGEDMPELGVSGTSFAAPRVAVTVANVQAIVHGLTGTTLDSSQMVDALQQGGAGPRSRPDPADGATRYFLHDHPGSLDYAWSHYGGTPTRALEYVASYQDLIDALGSSAAAGRRHFEWNGSVEERRITFDATEYIASYGDLVEAFGRDEFAGARHFIDQGLREGRSVTFDGLEYIASYSDLIRAFGTNEQLAAAHFIDHGHAEGRSTSFDGLEYIASYRDLILAFGPESDLGSAHFITNGLDEGRQRDLFDAAQYLANYTDLQAAFGADTAAATRHFIVAGLFENRTDDAPVTAADFLI